MNGYVLFQMTSWQRDELIGKHQFLVQQARARMLDPFTEEAIKAEADKAAEESYKMRGQYFNPDYDDPADNAEDAFEDGVWRYELLCDLREQTRLNIIAGFFSQWEKNLRQWLVDELQRWHRGDVTKDKLWTANLGLIFDLLDCFEWDFKTAPWYAALDACRLVVNIHKHGDGHSLHSLKESHPAFFVDPLAGMGLGDFSIREMTHKHLKVNDDDLDAFADAITEFWQGLPDDTLEKHIKDPPEWFGKALKKDRKLEEDRKKKKKKK